MKYYRENAKLDNNFFFYTIEIFRRCYNSIEKSENYILDLFLAIFRDLYIEYRELQIFLVNREQTSINLL